MCLTPPNSDDKFGLGKYQISKTIELLWIQFSYKSIH